MTSVDQRNPATGQLIGSFRTASREEVDAAFRTARLAQKGWAAKSFGDRAVHIRKMKEYLARNAERISKSISDCTGKTRQDALATEVLPCIMACEWYAAHAGSVLADHKLPCGNILFANKSNVLQHAPLGVVGIISPWNYPFSIPFGEIVMGLMAGNAVILKVATQTVMVGQVIEEVVAAGNLPPNLFYHAVCGGAQASDWMLRNGVNKIFFTGSVGVGKQLMRDAAATLTPLSLELGGNDAMVVLSDADLDRAANCAAWGGFQNAGQSCGGVQRIYVEDAAYQPFLDKLCAKTRALRHGPDTGDLGAVDIGAVTTDRQLESIRHQVAGALAEGATIAAQSHAVGDCSRGLFYPATVLTGVTHAMTIAREEVFGPVVLVMRVSNEDHAVSLANDCSMGLTASVHSDNGSRARAVAGRLEAGVVTINDHLYTHGASETPWGGWKDSGIGRTHGYLGLKEMCNTRCINADMCSGSMFPSNMWWFPFSKDTYQGVLSAVSFLVPSGWTSRMSSAATLVPFALKKMRDRWIPSVVS